MFVICLIVMLAMSFQKVEQSQWALRYNWWSESVGENPITQAGVQYLGVGNYLITFPSTNKYCYFRDFDNSFNPDKDDVFMPPITVRTNDGLKVKLEMEFVYRLQMAKLYDVYMLVGDQGFKNTMVHLSEGVITEHATKFSAQAFYGDRGEVADAFKDALTKILSDRLFIDVQSFQLQPAHFPPEYAKAIVETQEMKQDIQVALQENKTKFIQKTTLLKNAEELAHQIIIQADGDAQQTILANKAEVAQYSYRQQVLAEGYAKTFEFFGTGATGQDAVTNFLSYMKLEALKAHNGSAKTIKLSPIS